MSPGTRNQSLRPQHKPTGTNPEADAQEQLFLKWVVGGCNGPLPKKQDRAKPTPEQIRTAFLKAQEQVGRKFKLKGRGHAPRVSVNPRVGRAIGRLNLVSAQVSTHTSAHRTVYPRALVARAAKILRMPLRDTIAGISG